MRHLQPVMTGIGGEFNVAEEGGHVGRVERGGDFFRLDRIRLLDSITVSRHFDLSCPSRAFAMRFAWRKCERTKQDERMAAR